jgi:3-oxoacyl-[acyl-carrier-protein] synthase III
MKDGVNQVDEYVLHQVSGTHTSLLSQRLNLDSQKIMAIFPEFGNIGPAAVPIVLSKAAEAGRITKGSRVALMGIGSGLNCSMAEVVW